MPCSPLMASPLPVSRGPISEPESTPGAYLLKEFPGLQGILYLIPYHILYNLLLPCSSDIIFYPLTWSSYCLIHSSRETDV